MKISYDPDADALYVQLREDPVERTQEVDAYTMLDYDAEDNVIGVEMLFVKERNLLERFSLENITPSRSTP